MKNSGTALRTAYYEKLYNAITVRGNAVPVIADDRMISTPPYIFLGPQSATGIDMKGCYGDYRSITIDICTSSGEGIGGPAESEDIANQVCTLIAPKDYASWPSVGPEFQITTLEKIQEVDRVEKNATETIYRKILTFRHQIHELIN